MNITEALPLVRKYTARPGNGAGGALHIVLDDGNVTDGDVKFCISHAREMGDSEGERLAEILLSMSKTQRKKLAVLSLRG